MIKPNVLTHVIEGFVIQEANEPFPVTRQRYTDDADEAPGESLRNNYYYWIILLVMRRVEFEFDAVTGLLVDAFLVFTKNL